DEVERFLKALIAYLAGDVVNLNLSTQQFRFIEGKSANVFDQLRVRLGYIREIDDLQPTFGGCKGKMLGEDRFARARWPTQDVQRIARDAAAKNPIHIRIAHTQTGKPDMVLFMFLLLFLLSAFSTNAAAIFLRVSSRVIDHARLL